MTIDNIIIKSDEECGIPSFKISSADYLCLKEYVLGNRWVIDYTTENEIKINSVEDLRLLRYSNILARKADHYINPELAKIHNKYISNVQAWERILNTAFEDEEVIAHFGRAVNYQDYVKDRHKNSSRGRDQAKKDYSTLREYVLGQRPIIDSSFGQIRFIQKLEDLNLLCFRNLESSNGKRHNPELVLIHNRMYNRHFHKGTPNYGDTLDSIFQEAEVIAHLGDRADYRTHVYKRNVSKRNVSKIERPMGEYIDEQLIPLWISYKHSGSQEDLSALMQYYSNTLCMVICRKVFFHFPWIKAQFSSPEQLLSYTIEELEKRIRLFNINLGYKFESYAYHAIRGSVIDQLRSEHVLYRKGKRHPQTISIETPLSNNGGDDRTLKISDILVQ